MGLFKRNRQATDRVQDLKNRVESLRKVDDEHRQLTLNDFLAGDDAVTARIDPRPELRTPSPSEAVPLQAMQEDALEAELQRYIESQADASADEDPSSTNADDLPAPEGQTTPIRPISIEEFPPLPPPEDRGEPVREMPPGSPPRLSAEEEEALIAELQRFLSADEAKASEDVQEDARLALPELVDDDFTWGDSANPEFVAPNAFALPEEDVVPEASEPADELPRIVEIDGRTYVEPKPRHWPSVPLQPENEGSEESTQLPERRPKAAGDWEPL